MTKALPFIEETKQDEEHVEELESVSSRVYWSAAIGLVILFGTAGLSAWMWTWPAAHGGEARKGSTERYEQPRTNLSTTSSVSYEETAAQSQVVPSPDVVRNSLQMQQAALKKARVAKVRSAAFTSQQKLSALVENAKSVEQSIKRLLYDDEGRKIASNDVAMDRFTVLWEKQTNLSSALNIVQSEMEELVEPLMTESIVSLDDRYATQVEQATTRVANLSSDVESLQRSLEALRTSNSSGPVSGETLQASLDRREQDQAEERLRILAQDAQRIRQEEFEASRQRSAETARRIAKEEIQIRQLEEQRVLDEKLAEKDAKAAKVAKAKLEQDFLRDRNEVSSLLRPFITKGITQPGRHEFVTSANEGPVSFARVKGAGLLEPTVSARNRLYYFVGSTSHRELGAFPRFDGGGMNVQRQQPTMMRVQELLTKYGELMVEKKLLAP